MSGIQKITLTFILLIFCSPLWGSSFIFDHISQKDGLANNSVSGIVQDRRGYLWFATQSGLCRYDGKGFVVYEHEPFEKNTLPHDLIQTIYLDPVDPWLWIGTYDGVSRFNLETEEFQNYGHASGQNRLSNEIVTAVCRDSDGSVWLGTLDGLNRLDLKSGDILTYFHNPDEEDSLLNNTIRSLHMDSDGRLWVGSYGGVDLFDPETEGFRHFRGEPGNPEALRSSVVMALADAGGSGLWVGTWDGGVSLLDRDTGAVTDHLDVEGNVYLVYPDPSGDLWIGTWGQGLYRWFRESGETVHFGADPLDDYKLNNGIVYSFLRDRGGVYWIGTNGEGVNKLNPLKKDFRFLHNQRENDLSLPRDRIRRIMIDSENRFWVAMYSNGLWRFDGDSVKHWMPDDDNPWSLSHQNAVEVIEDSRGRVWVGTLEGLDRYNPITNDFDHFSLSSLAPGMKEPIVYAIQEDIDGSFWIGTYRQGLIHWSEEDGILDVFSHSPEDPRLSNNLIFRIFRDSRNNIWVGTNQGLNLYNRETGSFKFFLHDPRDRESLSNNLINDIFEDSRGRIWVATGGGLSRLSEAGGSFVHYFKSDGLFSNHIQALQEDARSRLWIACTSGISILNMEDDTIIRIDESDGIVAQQMYSASVMDPEGLIYFGSSEGVLRFNSDILYDNPHPPALWMNSIEVMGTPYPYLSELLEGRSLGLNWRQNLVSFEFAALDFTSPDQNQYRYMLEGLDRDWIHSGTRNYAVYQNLSPGNYLFKVTASNNDGVWSSEELVIPVHIKAPPWKQRWFVVLYFVAGILSIILFSNVRANLLLKKKLNVSESSRNNLQVLNDRLELLAWKDGLTGLSNRRYFDLSLNNLWHLAVREQKIITLLMIDVDHFKAYNDLYGHQKGDDVLKQTASLVKGVLRRDTDSVCRYGGEEIAVILFDTGVDEGITLCESILQAVREESIPHKASPVASYLTLSIGLASLVPGFEQLPDILVRKADDALYRAKNSGRNRYVVNKDNDD